jgi:hypothetical protein
MQYVWANDTTPLCESRTNDLGLVSCEIAQVPKAHQQDSGKGVAVRASVDIDNLLPLSSGLTERDRREIQEMLQLLKQRFVEFLLTPFVEKKNTRVVVMIREENLSTLVAASFTGNSIASKLVEAGYQVVGGSEIDRRALDQLAMVGRTGSFKGLDGAVLQVAHIAIVGTCTTRPGVRIPGLDLVPMRADGTVKAVDLGTGDTIAHQSLSNIVGLGITEEQAGINALQKMSGPLAEAILAQLMALGRAKGQ